jgi:Flp pilus assembly protein TadG
MLKNFKIRYKQFTRAEEGSVATIVGLGFLVLVGCIGVAVDIGRGQLVQTKLSSSLDAAGLAAASTVNTTNLVEDTHKYLNVNFRDYMGSKITDVQISTNDSNTIINISASATLPTTFMRIFGHETMNVSASSEITRAVSGLELVLVLDNTGSMAGTRLSQLKTAAKDLVNILFGDNLDNDKLWIGLVPFAQAVNIGPSRTSWIDVADKNAKNWGPAGSTWWGCVDARLNGHDVTDEPPGTQKFKAYYWPDDSNNDWIQNNGKYKTLSINLGPNKNCSQEVLPMTNDKEAIKDAIDNMTAVGNTHINLGAVWGWRMLSPKWRGLWGGDMDANGLPLDYNTVRMNKAAIIMTDGENTMSTSVRTAYWYPSDGRLGTTNTSTAKKRLDDRLSQVCTSMKDNNIIVYTIAFGNPGSTVKNLMRNCATHPDYYFDSPSGDELQAAFRAIGDSLSNLRVSK